jgi:hypothetical protein
MSACDFEKVIRKVLTLKALRRARAHVERLERELRGEPGEPQDSVHVPDFLRPVDVHQAGLPGANQAFW